VFGGKGYKPAMEWPDRVSANPAVRRGKPCIKGTRITVYDVLEYLAGGMTEDEILNDFPDLSRTDIRAALAFAAARERRLANSVAPPRTANSGIMPGERVRDCFERYRLPRAQLRRGIPAQNHLA